MDATANNGRAKGLENLRPWKPGQSGNPKGRPKGVARTFREVAGGDPEPFAQLLRSVALDEDEKTADRLAAAREYLDRGWGKAPSYAPVEGDALELDAAGTAVQRAVDELASRRDASTPGGAAETELARASEG